MLTKLFWILLFLLVPFRFIFNWIMCQNKFGRIAQCAKSLFRIIAKEVWSVTSIQQVLQHAQFAIESSLCQFRVILRNSDVVTIVHLQCFFHLAVNTDIVNNHSIFLSGEYSVHSADSLYKCMLLKRLVVVQYGETSNIKSCNPHIHNNNHLEVWLLVFKALLQLLLMNFITQKIP